MRLSRLRPRALLAAPGFVWLLVFFLVPLTFPIFFSFSRSIGIGGLHVSGFPTFATFSRVFKSDIYIQTLLRTLEYSLVGTVALFVLGFPLAYFLATRPRRHKAALVALLLIPSLTSFLVRTYAWIILLADGGPVSSVLKDLGVGRGSSGFLFTGTAVWTGIIYNYLPLMVLPLWAALERMDISLLQASNDLGASPFHTLRHVTLPLAVRGLTSATVFVFILLTGEYIIPALLGGGKVTFAGTVIVEQFQEARDWAFGSAIGLTMVVIALGVTAIYGLSLSRIIGRAST